jgi:hypothetical protein
LLAEMQHRINSAVDSKLVTFCLEANVDGLESYLNGGNFGKINHSDDKTGDTALHLTVSLPNNSYQMSKLLLDFGANPCCLNNMLESPVHIAARAGVVETLKLLIERGGLRGILSYHSAAIKKDSGVLKRHLSTSIKSKMSNSASCPTKSINSKNLLAVACESESIDCVEYLIDEVMIARKGRIKICCGAAESNVSETGSLDMKQFLKISDPKEVVFFEMGSDLAASNAAYTDRQLEKSLFGRMLTKTPRAFTHLLDSCIYTKGKATFVDFFLFHNELGGSELNLLKIIIHCGRFDLLTHPVCELFLHLKSYRARGIYWVVLLFALADSLMVITYVVLCYGEVGVYFEDDNPCADFTLDGDQDLLNGSLYCYGRWLKIPVLVSASVTTVFHLTKVYQDRSEMWSVHFWKHRPELFTHFFILVLIVLDLFVAYAAVTHKSIASLLVILVCRNMVRAIARDPDIAIFVEMVSTIQRTLFKFLLSYVWLFVGWTVAFHVTLGDHVNYGRNDTCLEHQINSFHDLGSASAKVMAMFTGELGFETAFSQSTSFYNDPMFTAWVIFLYVWFILEMCIILMNLLIGLSISNIQEMRQNADALRLTKEVVLQKYLESFMGLSILPRGVRVGRIADENVFSGKVIYSLCRRHGAGDVDQRFSLTPCETECLQEDKAGGINVPNNVVGKLDKLMLGNEQKREKKEKRDQDEVRKILLDLKAELEAIREQLGRQDVESTVK